MGVKVNFDPVTKIIQMIDVPSLVNGTLTSTLNVKIDLYSDGKEDYKSDPEFIKVQFPITTVGGDTLPDGSLDPTFFLNPEWKIRPYNNAHVLIIDGNLYATDGSDYIIPTVGAFSVVVREKVSAIVRGVIADTGAIQSAVWGANRLSYNAIGSMGEAIQNILGLVQQNFYLDNTIYNGDGLLTSARMRIFANNTDANAATDGGIGENELETFYVTGVAEFDNATQIKTYKVTQ